MGDNSKIEWTDATWNPVRGCSRVSEGCRNCYAETIAARFFDAGAPYHGFAERGRAGSKWTGRVAVIWPLLDLPLRWRAPRKILVNSMSDLFHESVTIEELAAIFAVMVAGVHLRGHTFQVLTKRVARMRGLLTQDRFWEEVNIEAGAHVMARTDPLNRCRGDARATLGEYGPKAPPPGIWLGVSVENQEAANERIPALLATPAALRFLSCEPLLGPLILNAVAAPRFPDEPVDDLRIDWKFDCLQTGDYYFWHGEDGQPGACGDGPYREHRIDWVICGGESGPGARPMHPAWARSLRDQCAATDVPFFFKQWGAYRVGEMLGDSPSIVWQDGQREWYGDHQDIQYANHWLSKDERGLTIAYPAAKKAAGALLDGREWREMPR